MKRFLLPFLGLCSILLLFGCGNEDAKPIDEQLPEKDVTNQLQAAITAFGDEPTKTSAAEVDRAFAEFDMELSELKLKRNSTEGPDLAELETRIKQMEATRLSEKLRYTKLRADAGMKAVKEEAGQTAQTVKEQAQQTGETIKEAANETGNALEQAAETTGDQLKEAGQSIKQAVDPE